MGRIYLESQTQTIIQWAVDLFHRRTNELAKRLILPKYNYSYSISPRFESIHVYTSTDKLSGPENQKSYDKELVSLSSSEHEWVNRCHQYRASASSLTLLEDTSAAPPVRLPHHMR